LIDEKDIKDIFGNLKGYLRAQIDMGFVPPPLSSEVLQYLETDISGSKGRDRSDKKDILSRLKTYVRDCSRCKLHVGRTKPVFGEGADDARLMFVGEAPGREEDLAGRPFVGEAGSLLTKIIKAMGLTREEVYICNVVKCRPPKNRDPKEDEIEACLPFVKQQIRIIGPEVICTLGRISARTFFGQDFKISRQRGRWRTYMEIPVMPTYHPAYLLRNPDAKREVWEDMQKIMKHLGISLKRTG
jgi:DNA polymerase